MRGSRPSWRLCEGDRGARARVRGYKLSQGVVRVSGGWVAESGESESARPRVEPGKV